MARPSDLIAHYSSRIFQTRIYALTLVGAVLAASIEWINEVDTSNFIGFLLILVVASLAESNRRYTHSYICACLASSSRESTSNDVASWYLFRYMNERPWSDTSLKSRVFRLTLYWSTYIPGIVAGEYLIFRDSGPVLIGWIGTVVGGCIVVWWIYLTAKPLDLKILLKGYESKHNRGKLDSENKNIMSEQTIPVQIDSIKRSGEFQKTRCAYFRIEITDGPLAGLQPTLYNDKGRLAMWGSWAALLGPDKSIDDHDLFVSPESISRTLMSIEETKGLSLDLSYIWLPNKLLDVQGQDNELRNGNVYRLPIQLFYQCYRFITDMITEDEWLNSCEPFSNTICFSPQETFAFQQWRKEQIKQSSDRYHQSDYADHRLPKKRSKK